jgi:hypothetical protein
LPAKARLKAEPMSFASAEAPAPLPTTLAAMNSMLRRMPSPARRDFAFAMPAPRPVLGEAGDGRVVLVTRRIHAEAHLFAVSRRLSEADVVELRRAVAEAAAEGREVKLRVSRGDEPGGGGGGHGFDINIQTLVEGE